MMMQENLEMRLSVNPNFTARSTTGTTAPRKLVTPRIQLGVLGTVVTASYLTISFTFPILTAYSSPAVRNVRYCTAGSEGCSFSCFEAFMSDSLCFCSMFRRLASASPSVETASGRRESGFLERNKIGLLGAFAINRTGICKFGGDDFWHGCLSCRAGFAGGAVGLSPCEAEEHHELFELLGLRCQFFGRAREFFGGRCVALRDRIDLRHGFVDLCNATGLLGRCRSYVLH